MKAQLSAQSGLAAAAAAKAAAAEAAEEASPALELAGQVVVSAATGLDVVRGEAGPGSRRGVWEP